MEDRIIEGIIRIKSKEEVVEALHDAFIEYKEDRFFTKIEKENNAIKIIVRAKDTIALRAAKNSYLRI